VKNPLVTKLSKLHEQAKRGTITEAELEEYLELREELGRMLLIAQHLTREGRTLRAALRMSTVLKVRLDSNDGKTISTTTIDLSEGGFACRVDAPLTVGKLFMFELALPNIVMGNGTAPISGTVKVASCRNQHDVHRISFTFVEVERQDRVYLELCILDAILARFDGR
jgi:hypothetical protein